MYDQLILFELSTTNLILQFINHSTENIKVNFSRFSLAIQELSSFLLFPDIICGRIIIFHHVFSFKF